MLTSCKLAQANSLYNGRGIGVNQSIVNLYEAKKNNTFQIAFVPNIGLLQNLGIRIGTQVVVQSRYALGGPVLLRIEDTFAVAIGKDIATQIAVKEVKKS